MASVTARFWISGDNLDFNYITSILPLDFETKRKEDYRPTIQIAGLAFDTLCYSITQSGIGISSVMSSMLNLLAMYKSEIKKIRETFRCKLNVTSVVEMEEEESIDLSLSNYCINCLSDIGANYVCDLYLFEKEDINYSKEIFSDDCWEPDNITAIIGFQLSIGDGINKCSELKETLKKMQEKGDDFASFDVEKGKLVASPCAECSVSDALAPFKECLETKGKELLALLEDGFYETCLTANVKSKKNFMDVLLELSDTDVHFLSVHGMSFNIDFLSL